MNIHEALKLFQDSLGSKLGDHCLPQAEQTLETLLHCNRTELYMHKEKQLSPEIISRLESIIDRRLNGEPLQYILGNVFFYNREFRVTPDVLIPRPDTEVLVEQVLSIEKSKGCLFADVGTGSGIISCILSEERPGWSGIGIDISKEALKVAISNRKTSNLNFVCADLLSAMSKAPRFDFLVSNPPYISADELKTLDISVRGYEPLLALYGGIDGLLFYRKLAEESSGHLVAGGRLYCEIGYNQEQMVKSIFTSFGWERFRVIKDLGGNSRVIITEKSGQSHD
jgi:release factor glutamine methyltransferase